MTDTAPELGSAQTAEALVRAGRVLFTRHGYDGASVRAITAAAGVNLGAITYHFGSKRHLYEQVVESCLRPLAERVEGVVAGGGAPLERVGAVVRAVFDFLLANPEVPHLMLQELAVGRALPETGAAQIRRLHGALARLVAGGQADGSIRAGNPAVMAITIVSNPVHLMLVRVPLRAWLGIDMEAAGFRREVVENAVAFACAGLAAREE